MSHGSIDAPLREGNNADPSTGDSSQSVSIPVRVLILEDRPEDAELVVHELRRSWYDPIYQRLETESEYLDHLKSPPDVILSDYRMPQLDAPRALELLQGLNLDIPFIVVSGAIGEDAAVAMMRQGATDYLLKDRLRRLGPAVRRALAEKKTREEKRHAEEALRASEARFYSFMNHSPALAFIKGVDGRILYMNNTCEEAWSMSLPQREGKMDALDLNVLQSGNESRTIEELRLPGGDIRHLLSYRFSFDDMAGCRVLGGMSVDITDQKRAERALESALATKETLLKEVHHRVKNNLQIVSSLLNMQSELLTDPGQRMVFLQSRQRVQCMALVHERLCSNEDLEQVDFSEYVEALTRDLFSAYGVDRERVRLTLALNPVSLELTQAIPCGLILNELISNALKYAFPGDRAGEIHIGLSCSEKHRVKLRVSDDGVGMPIDPDQKQTLGLGIVSVLTRQLGGKLERESGPGVGFSLDFEAGTSGLPVG